MSGKVAKSIKETYRDFAGNTSIHGTLNTIDGSAITRFLWTLIILGGVVLSAYMIILILWRYTSNPTITFIETDYASTSLLPFPAVTLCNNNKVVHSKLKEFVNNLKFENRTDEEVMNALTQLTALFGDTMATKTDDLPWLRPILHNNGFTEMEAMNRISQTCDEFLLQCRWEEREIYCSTYFSDFFTPYGRCCSFNLDIWDQKADLRTRQFGHHMGLQVITNNTNEEKQYGNFYSKGITVIVHHAGELIKKGDIHRTVSSGSLMFVQLFGTVIEDKKMVRALPQEQRKCYYPWEAKKTYFPHYSFNNCQLTCKIRETLSVCHCVPFSFRRTGEKLCDSSSLPCLKQIAEDVESSCHCPFQCENVIYESLSTGSRIVHGPHAVTRYLDGLDISSSSVVNVYWARDTYTHIKRGLVTNDLYLQSSLGGIFSLLLGFSFTSLAELLYAVLIRFLINLKVLNKTKPARITSKTDKPPRFDDIYDNTPVPAYSY